MEESTTRRLLRLLRSSDLSVTDICFDGGCTGLGPFTRTFVTLVGRRARRPRR